MAEDGNTRAHRNGLCADGTRTTHHKQGSAAQHHGDAAFHHEAAAHHHRSASKHYRTGNAPEAGRHAAAADAHGKSASNHGSSARHYGRGFVHTDHEHPRGSDAARGAAPKPREDRDDLGSETRATSGGELVPTDVPEDVRRRELRVRRP